MKNIRSFFDREQNLLVHITASIFVIFFGFLFKISYIEWFLIIFMIMFVITSELINSAIELVVDLYTSEFHPLAMVAKDVAAGAVVISAFTSLIVGAYVFVPKILAIL